MDLDILKRGFKLVEYIYDSQDLELCRIKEVGNGLAEKHWTGKQWLVDELSQCISNEDIHVAAGWLGLTSYLLRKEFPNSKITNSDMDPGCKILGEYLFHDQNIQFKTLDTILESDSVADTQVYVNTSIEHISQTQVEYLLSKLKRGTTVALQSNNYYSVDDHCNCCKDLNEFIYKTPIRDILYSGEMSFTNHDRYMIIGVI